MVQWLRFRAPNIGGPGSISGQGTRSQMLQLRVHMPYLKILLAAMKILHAAKTLCKYINIKIMCLAAQSCSTLCNPMDGSPPGSSVLGDSPGKNTIVGRHALLPGDLSNPAIEPRSPVLQALYHLGHQGSPGVLE